MYRGAMSALLSELARLERLTVVESLGSKPEDEAARDQAQGSGPRERLIIVEAYDEKLELASRNLNGVTVLRSRRSIRSA